MANQPKTRSLGLPAKNQRQGHSFRANTPPPDDLVGASIDGYTVIRRIGQGGMGSVFEVQHNRLEKSFALKLISESLEQDADAVQRFRTETLALGKLDHPNIVQAVDAGQWLGRPYLVTELIRGRDLASEVAQKGPLDSIVASKWILQAACALHSAHQHGIFHRDVKPSNLIVDHLGNVKLLDFGLVRNANSAHFTQSGCFMGSIDFLAPEQAADAHSADARSDLYSLGCTWIFLLSGLPPFPDNSHPSLAAKLHGHLYEQPAWLQQPPSDVPDWTREVIQSMIAKEANLRPASCQQIIDRLSQCQSASHPLPTIRQTTSAIPITSGNTADSPLPENRWRRAVLAIAALLAVATMGTVSLTGFSHTPFHGSSNEVRPTKKPSADTISNQVDPGAAKLPVVVPAVSKTETLATESTLSARGTILPTKLGKPKQTTD